MDCIPLLKKIKDDLISNLVYLYFSLFMFFLLFYSITSIIDFL